MNKTKISLGWKHCKNKVINKIYSFKHALRYWGSREDNEVQYEGTKEQWARYEELKKEYE